MRADIACIPQTTSVSGTVHILEPRRIRASLLHLLFSVVVAGGFAAAAYFLWYPAPLLSIQGGLSVIAILLLVDAVLGPLMTLLVFNPAKSRRELTMDLSLIIVLQASAFAYGAHVVYMERPQYLAFAYSQFYVIRDGDVRGDVPAALGNAQRYGSFGPRIVYADIPPRADIDGSALMATLAGDPRFASDARQYRLTPTAHARFAAESILTEDIPRHLRDRIEQLAAQHQIDVSDLSLYHVRGRQGLALAVVRLSDAQLLAIFDTDLGWTATGER